MQSATAQQPTGIAPPPEAKPLVGVTWSTVGAEPVLDEAVEFPDVLLPEISVVWPVPLAPTLRRVCWELQEVEPAQLLEDLPALGQAVDAALGRVGPNTLVPESLRYDPIGGWQIAALPRYAADGSLRLRGRSEPATPWTRDRRALVRALVDAVADRPCRDTADALLQLNLYAGEFPLGLDALCHLLLGGELRQGVAEGLAPLHQALSRRWSGRVAATCFLESSVGSRKARGRPGSDNEDAAGAATTDAGTTWLGVFDGVTGPGDGSGRIAAGAALAQAERAWQADEQPEPSQLLRELDVAVSRATDTGSAAAVLARVELDGRAVVVSAGDAEAWLIRPQEKGTGPEPGYTAWRLTPAHTAFAARLRHSPDAQGQESVVVSYLGGAQDTLADDQVTVSDFTVSPGDLLLLASDGATKAERGRWFGADLATLTAELASSSRPLGPAMAAALVHRAEALGGWDNATALVCEITGLSGSWKPKGAEQHG
ncbi:hypothetical protein [Streptomyces sp. NPDC055056]